MKRKLLLPVLAWAFLLGAVVNVQAQNITTVAGVGLGDDSLATRAELVGPVAMTMDNAGNYYIADQAGHRIRKVNPSGIITTYAGNGVYGMTGDGGPATAASIGVIYGLAMDRFGNLYFSDAVYNCIRKVSSTGIMSTIAGNSATVGYTGDGGPATAATLNNPTGMVVDTAGNLIFCDWLNNVVRKINTAGVISTIVGDGSVLGLGDHGPATASSLGRPFRVALDNKGNLYIAAVYFQCITKVDTGGIISIVADTTGTYALGPDGDGGPAIHCVMTSPCGLAVDTAGNIYFSDIGNQRVRVIHASTGIVTNFAATGVAGYGGDGGAATAAMISTPEDVFCDPAGNVYICDADNNRVRVVSTSGTISTFAGRNALFGEGYAGVNTELCEPANIATDAAGNLFIADLYNNRIRKYDAATGAVTTVAGSGIAGYDDGYSGDHGPATAANIYNPSAAVADGGGNLFIADAGNNRIRRVDAATGIITTFAGNGNAGYTGDHGQATAATLNGPAGVAVDSRGNVYIADQGNSRIRKVDTVGVITTVAGNGVAGYVGDGMAAVASRLKYPSDVALDGLGNMYIADEYNSRIRMVDTNGIITTIAGSTTAGYSGDGGPASVAKLSFPSGLKADMYGNVFFADADNERVRWIDASGTITTIAGNGVTGFSGDGGPATAARLNTPIGVALDGAGNLYISDASNHRIRKINVTLGNKTVQSGTTAVQVFPNPATDHVVVSYANADHKLLQITLADATGKVVFATLSNSEQTTIPMSCLAAGVYLLSVNGGSVHKVVKE